MGFVLLAIALALAALAASLVGLAFVPADYVFSAGTARGVRVRVRWLFGLVRVGDAGRRRGPARPPEPGDGAAARAARRSPSRARRRRAPRRFRPARLAAGLLAIEGLLPRVGGLVRDVVRSLGLRRGRIEVRAGLGDPADTGEMCGVVAPLLAWLPRRGSLRVDFRPDFEAPAFEASAEGGGRFVPARLVGALGRFALSGPGLRALKVLVWDARR